VRPAFYLGTGVKKEKTPEVVSFRRREILVGAVVNSAFLHL